MRGEQVLQEVISAWAQTFPDHHHQLVPFKLSVRCPYRNGNFIHIFHASVELHRVLISLAFDSSLAYFVTLHLACGSVALIERAGRDLMNRKWTSARSKRTSRLLWLQAAPHWRLGLSFLGGYQTVPSGHSAPSKEGYRSNWNGGGSKANWGQWVVINQERWFNDKSVPPNEILQPGFPRGCSEFKKPQQWRLHLLENAISIMNGVEFVYFESKKPCVLNKNHLSVCFGMWETMDNWKIPQDHSQKHIRVAGSLSIFAFSMSHRLHGALIVIMVTMIILIMKLVIK